MKPVELIAEAAAAGLRLKLKPDGTVFAYPKEKARGPIMDRLRAAMPELIAHLRRQRMANAAADRLRAHPELKRATVIEPDGPERFIAAVAVPCGAQIMTAIISGIRADDEVRLLHAFDVACMAGVQ